ncbi:uncharacterized protein LOC125494701 [Beta vulgaris subsp. vulgaris]|uniref:uncharacterized protein LOC125494701 n=1 Tax=Beta vulgaris subsp. vulgaris TaxID=3555 RepID=UPI002036A9EF|nr:uncharacterized protein LOC125494701 [Beta vulgaris subsp. vulgaris]
MKMFYWKLANGALATRVNLRKRKILSETPCPFCGDEEESNTHLFKDCEVTMRIWKSSNLGINSKNPANMDISQWTKNWLWFLMQDDSNLEGQAIEFLGTLWSIWLLRNKRIFNTSYHLNPSDTFEITRNWLKRWQDSSGNLILNVSPKKDTMGDL